VNRSTPLAASLIGVLAMLAAAAPGARSQEAHDDRARPSAAPPPSGTLGPVRRGAAGRPGAEGDRADGCCGGALLDPLSRFEHARHTVAGPRHTVVVAEAAGVPALEASAGEVLVELAPDISIAALARSRGLEIARSLPAHRAYVLRRSGARPHDLARELAEAPGVMRVRPNWIARTRATVPNDDMYPAQGALDGLGLEDAWDLSKGAGIEVAVLDTGFDGDHPDLRGALAQNGWLDVVSAAALPYDDNGHGTAVAGIIGARFQNTFGTAGVAPEASVYAVKVADGGGAATFADLIAGFDAATRRGSRIIVCALGAPVDDPLLQAAVKQALDGGAVVLAAAGNEPLAAPSYPAAYPGVLAVGGTAAGAPELSFSTALAPSVAALAPAETVLTTLPGRVWGYVHGTSAAAAHAAGVAALALAREPQLDRAGLERTLRWTGTPVAALAELREVFPARAVHALRAVEHAPVTTMDVEVDTVELLPRLPAAGSGATVRAVVRNLGHVPIPRALVKARYRDAAGQVVEIQPLVTSGLAPGEQRALRFAWRSTPPAGRYTLEVTVDPLAGETRTGNNARTRPATIIGAGAAAAPDVRLSYLEVHPLVSAGRAELDAAVKNLGRDPLTDVDVVFRANGQAFATQRLPRLDVASEARLRAVWPFPQAVPGLVGFEVEVLARPGETALGDNIGEARVRLGTAKTPPVDVLYQQSNGVDLIVDAPFRLGPTRPYLPLLVFCPSKGERSTATYVTIDRTRVWRRDTPAPSPRGTLVYDDTRGAPPAQQPAGLDILDEDGAVLSRGGVASADLFTDDQLRRNGRYNVMRVPRAALGVAGPPAAPVTRFVDAEVRWSFHRRLLWIFQITRSGSARKVMRVVLGPRDLPRLPGEGHYYDAHLHTIAEWYHASPLALTAPRKAYGGPLIMLHESAAAVGLIGDPLQVKDRIAVTDHNTFYNTTVGDPDHPDARPPFGPSSPARSPAPGGGVLPEIDRYRELYGLTSGEEVAFKQNQRNGFNGFGVDLPIGAHMLVYRGAHVEGPWHGGGFLPDPLSPNIDVDLDRTLTSLAQSNQAVNARAFAFAAHPHTSSSQGWSSSNLRMALGLDPARRTLDHVHASPPGFVTKGLQLWNGRSHRSLVAWHDAIATDLLYAFNAQPDVVFIRKVLGVAGSDAHGDFSMSIGRLATPIPLSFTFSVNSSWFGCARTWVTTEGVPGATAGERLVDALAGGRSVLTDGPLVSFRMDAEGRFSSADLRWHDGVDAAEDDDGLMGGHGAFDGGGTLLTVSGNPSTWIRYRYEEHPEVGANAGRVDTIHIYRDGPFTPNPTRSRGGFDQPLSVGGLAAAGPGQDLAERLDPAEEGLVTQPAAFSLGAFTGGDPDAGRLGLEERRCYTNPVWAVPVAVSVNAVAGATGIAAGDLQITLELPITMDPTAGVVEVKALDANGDSTGRPDPALAVLRATWSAVGGVANALCRLENTQPIPTTGDAYPAAGRKTFCVYFREPPRDAFGNALNPLAFTFEVAGGASGSGGSTSSPSRGGGGGGSSSGGCALATADGPQPGPLTPLFALLFAALTLRTGVRLKWVVATLHRRRAGWRGPPEA
jgi:thermitase